MYRFEKFSLSVFGITRYWNKIATEEMKEYDLKGTYALYLVVLSDAKEVYTAAQLSELTQRDKADVSRAIAELRKKGIVESCGESRYRAPIRLTEQGVKLTGKIKKKISVMLDTAGEGLSDEMRRNMYRALEIVADNMKQMAK